jgi:hypothetical protein
MASFGACAVVRVVEAKAVFAERVAQCRGYCFLVSTTSAGPQVCANSDTDPSAPIERAPAIPRN